MGIPHILMVPYPTKGHAIPTMELAQILAQHGLKITLVSTKSTHQLVLDTLADEKIHLVSISEHGVENIADTIHVMPGIIEKLIEKLNDEGEKITCILADASLGWAMEIGKKMGVKRAAFLATAATLVVMGLSIPRLIDEGVIHEDGTPTKNQVIQLSSSMPSMNIFDFPWASFDDLETKKIVFKFVVRNTEALKQAERIVCNSAQNMEPGAFAFAPDILPIGPLLPSNHLGTSGEHFFPRGDSICLKWLDEQPIASVVYAAFGTTTNFNHAQFKEIALGLELTNKPFLWVVGPGMINDTDNVYPDGFLERVACRAKIVEWAPQKKVLSHPSVACFVSHCGWNSTIEGVSGGVPFLCWPYFADHFVSKSYICDVWKVGLGFEKDESGIVSREIIKNKVKQVLGDAIFKERALQLKEETMNNIKEGGSSFKNRNDFVEWIKA